MLIALTTGAYSALRKTTPEIDRFLNNLEDAEAATKWAQVWWTTRVPTACLSCNVPFVLYEYCFVPGGTGRPGAIADRALCLDCAIDSFLRDDVRVPDELLAPEVDVS